MDSDLDLVSIDLVTVKDAILDGEGSAWGQEDGAVITNPHNVLTVRFGKG